MSIDNIIKQTPAFKSSPTRPKDRLLQRKIVRNVTSNMTKTDVKIHHNVKLKALKLK